MTVISVTNVNKLIAQRQILTNVNFKIEKNEICGLIGPNGVGKTTLLKIILGLIKPDGGMVTVNDKTITKSNSDHVLSQIGVMLKYPESISNLTIGEVFKEHEHYMQKKQVISTVKLLKLVKLNIGLKIQTGKLSLGMKQRLLLALALSHDPNILILDEPFNGLDIDGVTLFKSILKRLQKQGKSIIVTSHSLNDLDDLLDSVILIDNIYCHKKITMKTIKEKYNGKVKNYYQEVCDNVQI